MPIFAPHSANFSAMALPIPREDPVIKAYLPFSDIPFDPPLRESPDDQTLLTGRRKQLSRNFHFDLPARPITYTRPRPHTMLLECGAFPAAAAKSKN